MKTFWIPIIVLGASLAIEAPFAGAQQSDGEQEYAALMRSYRPVSGGIRDAKTDAARNHVVEQLARFPMQFLDIADRHRGSPAALKSLRQAVQVIGTTDSAAQIAWESNKETFPSGIHDGSPARLVQILERDFLESDAIATICDRMRYGYRLEFEGFLKRIIDHNPNRSVQAEAVLDLALFLNDRLRMLQIADEGSYLTERFTTLFGEEYLASLERRGPARLEKEITSLLERAMEFETQTSYAGFRISERARKELYALENLAVGKVAPDTTGLDQNGESFKLRDYRGSVVLLYFWMEF